MTKEQKDIIRIILEKIGKLQKYQWGNNLMHNYDKGEYIKYDEVKEYLINLLNDK